MWKFLLSLLGERPSEASRAQRTQRPALEALEDRAVPAATIVDLTTANATGTVDGAVFTQVSPQPTGTGVIRSFVRLNAGGNVAINQGYNTDARPLQFDENNSPQFTRSIQVSDAAKVVIDNVSYREFLLDINQKASSPLLSLDELRIYTADAPNLSMAYDPNTKLLAGHTAVYDLDANGDHTVLLNARLTHGSGSGDMTLLVREDLLTTNGNSFVYLYSKFGATKGYESNGGFEEWAVHTSTTTPLATLSGTVYLDNNNNNTIDSGDTGQFNILVTLTGKDDLGQDVMIQAWTDSSGNFSFNGLRPGTYSITVAPPAGELASSATGDTITTTVSGGLDQTGLDFLLIQPLPS
jgi:hypothetical protein